MSRPTDIRLLRLLQLASPSLPVGAYSYSQGLEPAIAAGIVNDYATATRWLTDVLEFSAARLDAPVLLRLIIAWETEDFAAVKYWNEIYLAGRETAELRAESLQMGFSLVRLLSELSAAESHALAYLKQIKDVAFPTGFAFALVQWQIDAREGLTAYLWSWLENQILVAVKTVPLGQSDGQRILFALAERLPAIVANAASLADEEIGSFMPKLAILSSAHETQYSRLFRS